MKEQTTNMIKLKFIYNKVVLKITNKTHKIVTFGRTEMMGVLDLRSLGFYKIVILWPDVQHRKLSYCQLKSIDKPSFASDLESICQDLLQIDDLNELAVQYNCRLLSLLDKHAPVISKTLFVHPKVPWFSPNLNYLKRQRRKAEKLWRSDLLNPDS